MLNLVIRTKLYRITLPVSSEEAAQALIRTICRGALDCDPEQVKTRGDAQAFRFDAVRIYIPGHTVEEAWLEQTGEITDTQTKSSSPSSPDQGAAQSVETATPEPPSASMS